MSTPTPFVQLATDTQYLPCLNPQCKSHGKPHPNCRCYGAGWAMEMSHPTGATGSSTVAAAHGGEISHFCSESRAHHPDCEYFAGGGDTVNSDDLPDESSQQEPPKFDDLPEETHFDSLPDETPIGKYESGLQKTMTALEGSAEGWAGPVATAVELGLNEMAQNTDPSSVGSFLSQAAARAAFGPMAPLVGKALSDTVGLNPEDIAGRRETNRIIHGTAEAANMIASMFTGVGQAGAILKGAETAAQAAQAAKLTKIGSAVLRGAIEGASFTGEDEITKAMIGVPGSDPSAPVSSALLHVGAGGLLGGAVGGVFNLGNKLIGEVAPNILKHQIMINVAEKYLAKAGESGTPISGLVASATANSAALTAAAPIAVKSPVLGIAAYKTIKKILTPITKVIAGKVLGPQDTYVTDAIIKSLLTNEATGVPNAIHYATQVCKGTQKITSAIENIFQAGVPEAAEPASESVKQQIKDGIENGQMNEQLQESMIPRPASYAQGGMVSAPSNSFANIFPEQNMMLHAAKGRISQYLNSIRPIKNQPKLAFDDEPTQTEKKRSYEKAIEIAANPMSIMDNIHRGDLTTEHLQHFTSLYPEAHQYLKSEITKRITQAQLSGEKPPYSKRQALSLFLGVPLDGTFTPQAIQTIQGLYAAKQAQQQAQVPTKNKKGTSQLAKGPVSHLTDDQAREQRQQNQKA